MTDEKNEKYNPHRLLEIFPRSSGCGFMRCESSLCNNKGIAATHLVVIKKQYSIPPCVRNYRWACARCAGQLPEQLNGDDIERVQTLWKAPMAHWLEPCSHKELQERGCRYCLPNHPWENDEGVWVKKC